jgi:hypothetical protein
MLNHQFFIEILLISCAAFEYLHFLYSFILGSNLPGPMRKDVNFQIHFDSSYFAHLAIYCRFRKKESNSSLISSFQ